MVETPVKVACKRKIYFISIIVPFTELRGLRGPEVNDGVLGHGCQSEL